ncbi:metal-dependent hydrolase [Bacillus sp. HMF5848]|uniref:metal-dependent hydrolase n=1 Tax=Bacillus sp. HMF5848 TaxID=2495421 RepID=UPI000F7AB37E|nr:metal-dependent hydrolase [Bacillus sp. HMF5848]RSK26147.1 metal-dependent hydrolase [Bacillus sp. HMF5848]
MDTGTHVVMGLALGAMATLDPAITPGTITGQAVLVGTLIGSQLPDSDTVLKLVNNAKYIRNHRGITHSLPAVLLWPILATIGLHFVFPEANILHVWIWTFIAVCFHVFVDIFNAYGTQALRPLSNKWVAIGVINTFDPFIFSMHVVGLILWRFGFHPGYTFIGIYIVLLGYYVLRFYMKHRVIKACHAIVPHVQKVIVSPTLRFTNWHLVIITDKKQYVAKAAGEKITIVDSFEILKIPDIPVVQKAMKDKNLSAFLSFSPVYRWEFEILDDHYEVRFTDLRYLSKGYYPFVAVVKLDLQENIISSYTGWIFSEAKLMKKLKFVTES